MINFWKYLLIASLTLFVSNSRAQMSGGYVDLPNSFVVFQGNPPWSVSQSGIWTVQQGTPPWSVSQSGVWTTGRTWTLSNGTDSIASVQSGPWTVQQGTPPWSVSQSGTWTTGRTWSLSNTTDSVNAVQSGTWTVQQGSAPWSVSQSGTWNLNNISGTISLPTGAATDASVQELNVALEELTLSQGSSTSGQVGPIVQGAVTTSAPSYSSGQTNPISLSLAGGTRSDVTQFGDSNISTGTGSSGAGIPRVTISNDSAFLSTGSGSISTNGGTLVVNTNGASSIAFVASGIWSGALVAQGSVDGTTFNSNIIGMTGLGQETIDLVANGTLIVNCAGFKSIQLISAFFSGTANISWAATSGMGYIPVVNSVYFPLSTADNSLYKNINTAATTVIKSGSGVLYGVSVNTLVNGATMTIYDNTAGSGTKIATETLVFATALNTAQLWSPTFQRIGGAVFNTGLTAVTTGTADWTIYYR